MKFYREYIAQLKTYFLMLMICWLIATYLLLTYGYHKSFLLLNSYHGSVWDKLVPYLTQFGDSLILSSLLLIIFIRKDMAVTLTALTAIILSGLVIVSLKHFVFPEWDRPLRAIGEGKGIHYIQGFVEYYGSFPSGHSTTIASAFPFIAYNFRKNSIQVLIVLSGVLFSYTRIYLGSHFLGDVLAGSVIGTIFAIISLGFFLPIFKSYFNTKEEMMKRKIEMYSMIFGAIGLCIGLSVRFLL